MDVTATQTIPAQTPPAQTATSSKATSSALTTGADFETFLKMLTAQMQNQDPLNPMASTDFATQLATFSGVEQQVQTNDLLRSMGAGSAIAGLADYAGWVGMDARVTGSAEFTGDWLTLHFDAPEGAAKAELVVTTPEGLEVQRRDITGVNAPYSWDGVSANGRSLLEGNYDINVEATTLSGRVDSVPVATYARVTEIRSGAEGPEVVLAGGRSVGAADVTALRAAN